MLINIPYWARIGLLIVFAVAAILYDRLRRRGNTDRQWEYGFLFFAGILGAVYGALHDAITVSLSPEYFELGKRLTADTKLTLSAMILGAQAGFSASAIACAIWHYALRKTPPPQRCHTMLRLIWVPFAMAGLFALFMPLAFGHKDPLHLGTGLFFVMDREAIVPFLAVWWTHLGSYIGLVLGLLTAIVISIRRSPSRQPEPNTSRGAMTKRQRRWRLLKWLGSAVIIIVLAYLIHRRWMLGPGHFAYPDLGHTPDKSLPSERPSRGGAELKITTPDDFPEFLGAGRLSAVDHITLEPDWQKHPPREVWRQPVGAGWSAFSIVNGFAVTMEQRGYREETSCYELHSGKHQWTVGWAERFTTMGTGPRSTPTIANGRVYALGAWGHLVCVDGNSGKVLWERELLNDMSMHWTDENRDISFGRCNSPLVTDDLVIVPGGGLKGSRASLLAYDAATGAPSWRGGEEQISYSSPALAEMLGKPQILIVNEDTVAGHAVKTGEELWSYPWPGNSDTDANVSQPVPLSSSRILISKGYRRGAAVIELFRNGPNQPIKVRKVWSNRSVLRTKFTNVVIWRSHAYGLSEGVLECVDLIDGQRKWKAGRRRNGQILRVKGHLLILGEDGELVLVGLDPQKPNNVLGRLQALTGTTWNNIALYGRFLLIRNGTEAVCYELATVNIPK